MFFNNLKKLNKAKQKQETPMDREQFDKKLDELLTESEIETLSKRWRILNLLNEGVSQREIAKDLGVSLEKVYATDDSLCYKINFDENTDVILISVKKISTIF